MIYAAEILLVNTVCIQGNKGNIQIRGIFFVAFQVLIRTGSYETIKSYNLLLL